MKKLTAIGIVCLALGIWLEGLAVKNHFEIINYVPPKFPCMGCLGPSSFPVQVQALGVILLASGIIMLLLGFRKKLVKIVNTK